METDEERIALFLDYENLAIGARDHLSGAQFDLRPVLDALAERGRVIARKAYADWSYFDEDRRRLTRSHVELIEIPQRMGASRKNAADIKLSVDALEMAFERDYVTTFVICTGDSDFTPLVHKLRELNKRVIGVGIKDSTSALLPPACDEFLFYETLEGVDVQARTRPRRGGRSQRPAAVEPEPPEPDEEEETRPRAPPTSTSSRSRSRRPSRGSSAPRAGPCGPPRSSGRCCARTPPSARTTTASARSASCSVTWRSATSWSSARGPPTATPRCRSRPTAGTPRRSRSSCRSSGSPGARRPAASVGAQEPGAQGPARLQREEVRVPRVPAVLQGGGDEGLDRAPLGSRGRGLRGERPRGVNAGSLPRVGPG